MIENANASKNPMTGDYLDIKKYIGVASVNIVAVNPNNETLRKFGWNLPEDADEPNYISTRQDANGKTITSARVRLLAQVQDFDEKPIVSLDFWVRPEKLVNKEGTKCKIIDQYGRTAWATKEEVQKKEIPTYSNGNKANISTPYKMCHSGEEELVSFLLKYLNVTPFQMFDRVQNSWVPTKNPGKLTIDDWNGLCNANVKEIAEYLACQPENRVKVVLGVRSSDDNKTYQTFLTSKFIGNGVRFDLTTGEYAVARKAIDSYMAYYGNNTVFSASPVKEWKETATQVTESKPTTMFDDEGNFVADDDDLPFGE